VLDKSDPVPLYMQLQRRLREEILSGQYVPGEKIPSETELTKRYQITRTTVRKAISNLVNEGLLEQIHGKGTYVRFQQVKYSLWNFGGFTDYLTKKNEVPVSKVLEQKRIYIQDEAYFKLVRARGVKKEEKVIFLTIDTSILPLKLFPDIDQYDFERESLYHVFRNRYSIFPRYSEIKMSPVKCDERMIEIFKLDSEESLLLAEGRVFDEEDREIERVKVVYGPNIEIKIMTTMN